MNGIEVQDPETEKTNGISMLQLSLDAAFLMIWKATDN
ncbi:MAG: hypothetical protein ACI9U5_001842 [Colwellia sp.]|jgi:hypothetical protein